MLQIQIITGLILALIFFGFSLFWLRKRHMNERVTATRVGAFLYGCIFAGFVMGVMMPMRLQLMSDPETAMNTNDWLIQYLPAFAFFILVIRSDVTGRLPGVGTFIRAYRGAMLRRTIEGAEKRLEKIAALDDRAAAGA